MNIRALLVALFFAVALQPTGCDCSQPAAEGEGEGGGAEGEGAGEGEGEGAGEGEGEGGAGCTVDTDCNAGQVCDVTTHTCTALACGTNADCGGGQVCDPVGHTCVAAACTTAADCGAGRVCDPATSTCVGVPCASDADCSAGQLCFADGTCGNSPLQDPYQAFCVGTGTVVGDGGVGAGNLCLGNVAQQTFQFGFCACSDVTADGSQVHVDSFDSRNGSYASQTPGPDGNFGVDGQCILNVQMSVSGTMVIGTGDVAFPNGGNNAVGGDLYAFGNASASGVTIGHDAFVAGTIRGFDVGNNLFMTDPSAGNITQTSVGAQTLQLDIPQVAPCPCQPDQKLDIAGIVAFGATHNDNAVLDDPATTADESLSPDVWASGQTGPAVLDLPCGRFHLNGVEQSQGLTVHATDRTVLFIDGNFIANSLQVQLDPGAEVDIFVTGNMSFSSSSNLGNVDTPSAVRTYVNGQLTLGAQATFGGLIYAPNADVVFNASAEIFGALFVNTAQFSGNTNIHFDSAVRAAGDQCPVPGEGEGEGEGGAGEGEGEGGAGEGEGEGGAGEGEGEGAGPGGCSQCDVANVCGAQACIVAPGATTGTCGACRTSIDCCFPQICASNGTCIFLGG